MYMRRAERPEAKARKKPSCNNLIFFSFYFEIIKFELKKNKEGEGEAKNEGKMKEESISLFLLLHSSTL
jgi:hypothetical protein